MRVRLKRIAAAMDPARAWWLAGTGLAILAVHGNWNVPLAAWLFPPLLLRYARLRAPARAIVGVGGAVLASQVVWLLATGLIGALVAVLAFLFLSALLTVPFALDRLIVPRFEGLAGTLLFPASRVAMEYLFVVIAGFGSWGTLGATQHHNLWLIQVASVTGVYGVTFLVAWFGSLVNYAWDRHFRWEAIRFNVLVYAAVLGLIVGAGATRLQFFPTTSRTVRVAGISPSRTAEQASKTATRQAVDRYWDPRRVAAADPARIRDAFAFINNDLLEGTGREARAGARIVLWPETQARVLQHDLDALVDQVKAVSRREDVYVNMAFALYTGQDAGIRNVAMLVTPRGEVAWTYDKAHPTPMEPMAPGPGIVPVAESPYGRLANVICYDADYPDLMRQAAAKDADVVLVPADDWPGFEHLHAENAVLRAVEHGYTILRQSSHGVSTAINAHGRIVGSVDYFSTEQPTMIAAIPVQPRVRTLYSRIGDLFAWLCLAGVSAVAALEASRFRGRRRQSPLVDA